MAGEGQLQFELAESDERRRDTGVWQSTPFRGVSVGKASLEEPGLPSRSLGVPSPLGTRPRLGSSPHGGLQQGWHSVPSGRRALKARGGGVSRLRAAAPHCGAETAGEAARGAALPGRSSECA